MNNQNGILSPTPSDGGMKYDKGKLQAGILFEDFPLALKEVMNVATFGAQKYARSSWKTVPNARQRYGDALVRHQIEMNLEDKDPESNILHLAHFAWNALALLQLKIEEDKKNALVLKQYANIGVHPNNYQNPEFGKPKGIVS